MGPTGVLGTTGALGGGVSTPRPLVTRERRLVCQRRSRQHLLFLEDNKLCLFRPLLCFLDAALHHEHSLKAEHLHFALGKLYFKHKAMFLLNSLRELKNIITLYFLNNKIYFNANKDYGFLLIL